MMTLLQYFALLSVGDLACVILIAFDAVVAVVLVWYLLN